ncbi:MAG: ABC transporter ATP-binding protein [Polaromonas sp.]|nr:ABC transporter ATP-binding protein [Polaromonas sp.]
MPLLKVIDLNVRYGQIQGTNGVSFEVEAGETMALIGSNGAGKSSTLKAILGMVPVAGGQIEWEGERINDVKSYNILRLGIGFSPEGRRVFPGLTVGENLKIGGYTRSKPEIDARMEQMFNYFPRLRERHKQDAGSLSGGEQQMLAIGRALMSYPRLFLLDEPSLGLAPIIVERIGEILQEIQATEKIAVILAEQNATWALNIASRAVILELGRNVAEGPSQELIQSPKIRNAYLGIE